MFNLSSLKSAGLISAETNPYESAPTEGSLPSGSEKLICQTSGTFSATNVGEYTATITFSINSDYQQNYKFAGTTDASVTVTKTWEIAEAAKTALTLKVNTTDADNKFVYGNAIALTAENVTATGLNAGDTIANLGKLGFVYSDKEDGTYTSTVPTTAGTWYVKVAEFVESNEAGATNGFKNYSITYAASELKIKPKVIVLTAESQTIL